MIVLSSQTGNYTYNMFLLLTDRNAQKEFNVQ